MVTGFIKRCAGTVAGLVLVGAVALVPAAAVGATQITAGGPPVQVTVASSGGTAQLTFDGTVGERISLKITASTIANAKVTIKATSTAQVASASAGSTGYIDTKLLNEDGIYTILVDPATTYTGSMTPDAVQRARRCDRLGHARRRFGWRGHCDARPGRPPGHFSGTAGQRVSVGVSGNSYKPNAAVTLLQPDGVTSSGTINVVGPTGFLDTTDDCLSPAPTRCGSTRGWRPPGA